LCQCRLYPEEALRLCRALEVETIWGRARITDPHTVAVVDRTCTAAHILVATGSWPVIPDIPGKEYAITSNEAFYLPELPKRAIIVGGGYIAVEFAGIFHGLGVEVTQLYRGAQFLRGFDDDIRMFLAEEMRTKGIDLRFNTNIARIAKGEDGLLTEFEDGTEIPTDLIMYATGRTPNTADLGLEVAGVDLDVHGAVVVDDYFQSSVPSIYAIGDVIDRMQLTPVAIAEAMALVDTLFRDKPSKMDYADVPTAVFSQPPIGTVGLTEAQARDRHGKVDIYLSTFRALKHTLSGRGERTMMKLIVEPKSDRVLGCHMVGPDAGEIIQGLGVALKCGATKAQFDATVGIHPTAAEEFVTMREKIPEPAAEAAD
jgi:glutathione reductase (NADPH)